MKILKRALIFIMASLLALQGLAVMPFAEGDTKVFSIDSVNGIRWENYICLYRDMETTGQNVYGCNVVVDSNGVVTETLAAGDPKGENLAIPVGGYVVSGIGERGNSLYDSVSVGDNCIFDEYGMRVLFASGEINPFTEYKFTVNGFNTVRGENMVIVYNKAGTTTDTNPYGCEAVVNADGCVISVGGNNKTVPEGGFVLSVVGGANINNMLGNFTVGAKCTLEGNTVTVVYSADELKMTALCELDYIKQDFENAKKQYRLIDYTAVQEAIDAIDVEVITDIETRNAVIQRIKNIKALLLEQKAVEMRSVWHEPVQRNAEDIKAVIEQAKYAKLNEFIIYLTSANGTLVPIPDSIPFDKDPISESFDVLQTYIDECRKNGLKLTVVIPVMSSSLAKNKTEWHDATNTGEQGELFYSPANDEYRKAFMDYISFILDNYDIDGLQLDYIRYSGYFGGVESGYDDDTIALFEEKTGYGADVVAQIGQLQENHRYWSVWRNFKVELINSWVKECYTLAKSIRPDVYVTAAVAESVGVTAYSQDYEAWIKGGYIDGVYPMTYTQGVNELTVSGFAGTMSDRSFLVMGSGSYLGRDAEYVHGEAHASAIYGADGIGHFEWTAFRDQNYTELFANALESEAIPLIDDKEVVVAELLKTAEKRVNLYNGENADTVKTLVTKSTDKADIEKSIADIEALIPQEDAKYLLADLKTAVRVLNMTTDTGYEFKKGENKGNGIFDDLFAEENVSSEEDSQIESQQSEVNSEATQSDAQTSQPENNSMVVIVAIAVVLVVVLAVVLIIIKKKK